MGAYSNNGEHRIIKKTPAVTIVAAWINAETGVGPSMASGNQTCKPTWADLPTAPMNKNKQISSTIFIWNPTISKVTAVNTLFKAKIV